MKIPSIDEMAHEVRNREGELGIPGMSVLVAAHMIASIITGNDSDNSYAAMAYENMNLKGELATYRGLVEDISKERDELKAKSTMPISALQSMLARAFARLNENLKQPTGL